MAYKDLRQFMSNLEVKGLLKRVTVEVDPYLEIAHISDRVCKQGGPALLFESVKGSQMPVLTNIFGTMERLHMALGIESMDEVADRIRALITKADVPQTLIDKLKVLPMLAQLGSLGPKLIKKAPCQEVVSLEPSLDELPVLTTWPGDAGPFITLPLVFTKDPNSGQRNLGMYRLQIFDSKTTGMHWHLHKDGADNFRKSKVRFPVAVALGGDPVITYAATAPLPKAIDELLFAGFLRQQPVELVRCKTIDLEVPAEAEIILEGYVEVGERRIEGPFGDHTGYYSPADQYPVFHVTCLTRRHDAIYPATVVGKPPMEDTFLGKATERAFLPLIQLVLPEVVDINLPAEGGFHNLAIVSIKKNFPFQGFKVMNALWGLGQMMLTKMIIVVDAEVDVQNLSEVLFRVSHNVDPQRDIIFSRGPLDALDHSSSTPMAGSKLGIDATRKNAVEGHHREWPDDLVMDDDVQKLVQRKWKEYGF